MGDRDMAGRNKNVLFIIGSGLAVDLNNTLWHRKRITHCDICKEDFRGPVIGSEMDALRKYAYQETLCCDGCADIKPVSILTDAYKILKRVRAEAVIFAG